MNHSNTQAFLTNKTLLYSFLASCIFIFGNDDLNSHKKLMTLASAHIVSQAIHVAAKLRVADFLVDGPCHVDKLAQRIQTDSKSLYRLLRLLASYEIFYEHESHIFSLTPLAELLVSTNSQSLQPWLVFHDGDEMRWRSYGHMMYSIQTGRPAFNQLFGQGYFDYLANNNDAACGFDEGMRNLSEKEDHAIAAGYNFVDYSIITDIGGGKGGLITAIASLHHTMQGILYDLPHVQDAAESNLCKLGMDDRIIFKSGTFFESIPCNSDLYILKRILHDWDDTECLQILSHCKKTMKKNARLLIIEAVVSSDNDRHYIKDIDLAMLVLFGGQERTYDAWKKLLDQAGLQLIAIHPTASMLSILEIIVQE